MVKQLNKTESYRLGHLMKCVTLHGRMLATP